MKILSDRNQSLEYKNKNETMLNSRLTLPLKSKKDLDITGKC